MQKQQPTNQPNKNICVLQLLTEQLTFCYCTWLHMLTSALARINSFTTSKWPSLLASVSAVCPSYEKCQVLYNVMYMYNNS